jgi:hypothetical protein
MIFKFVATVSVLTTFLVVVTMLLPASGIGMISWPYFLFAHVIDPVLALVSFAFFEVTPIIKKRKCFYVVAPLAVYTAVVSPLASLKIVKDPVLALVRGGLHIQEPYERLLERQLVLHSGAGYRTASYRRVGWLYDRA